MTDHCRSVGRALIANGYLPVPIRRGEKRPAISGWQKARLDAAALDRFPDHGVGVLCGQGEHPIVGVDVDISHPVIGPAVIAWCHKHLGCTAERVGAAPRTLLVYRAATGGWTKGYSTQFFDPDDPVKASGKKNDQMVEILGLGQQFVAYHQHPDTGRDYEWVDLMGGIALWAAGELPMVTEAQVDALLVEVARLVRVTPGVEIVSSAERPGFKGSDSEEDALLGLSSKADVPLEKTAALLAYLDNDGDHYDIWLHVGAALHHEYAGTADEPAALDLWRSYGSKSDKDKPEVYEYKWRSFGRNVSAPTTLRWLIKQCNQAKQEHDAEVRRAAVDEAKSLIKAQTDTLGFTKTEFKARLTELSGIVDNALFDTEVAGALQAQYKALTKTTLPISQARALFMPAKVATVKTKRPLTEFGNAERMLDRFGDGLMYVPEMDAWYIWTGVYWRKAVKVEIEHLAKETIRALVNEVDEHGDDKGEFFQFCALSQQAKMVKNMVSLAGSDPRVMVPARELDKNTHLFGVRNGVVDLRTGSLVPPDPEYRITLVAGCNYEPRAQCPLFERTARQVFYDSDDMVRYFWRVLGYSMMGNPREEVMFIPFGNGANGKGTLLNAVRMVMGDYARSAEAASFISDNKTNNAGGAREDLVRLRGSRFVYVNEPDEAGELREGAVKSMTGGDSVTARGVFAPNSIELSPTWVVFMPTNHKPIVKGSDNGIWRRLVLLPFTRNFAEDPLIAQDKKLKDKLTAEKEGVLALLVRAAMEYQKHGLDAPAQVKEASNQYRKDMDLLTEWLDECCELGPAEKCESAALWQSWRIFAENRGTLNYIKSSIALGRKLEARFPAEKGSRGTRWRVGITLKGRFEDESVAGVAG